MARTATTPKDQATSATAAGEPGANGGGRAGTAVSQPPADSPAQPRPDAGDTLGLPPVIGGPSTTPWRESALTRAAELSTLANWLRETDRDAASARIWQAIEVHLEQARLAAEEGGRTGLWARLRSWITGAAIERAESNIDAAEADLLRLAPLGFLQGQLASIVASARQHLSPQDPRRQGVEQLAREVTTRDLRAVERGSIVATVRAANSAGRREVMRVRSFRNVLLTASVLLTVGAIGLAVVGYKADHLLPLCFTPDDEKVVCATSESAALTETERARIDSVVQETSSPWDVTVVSVVGLIAAAVAATAALRRIRGTSTPYSLPVALAVLKLPTGALTAVLGLLLMRGAFVPGLSALDSPAQIVAWAVVFGYAQELFTRLVDRQAQVVLDDVGGPTGPVPSAA